MPTTKLTARTVEYIKAPPSKQQIDHWDESLPGFGLRVSSTNRKTWVVMYRYNRRLRRLTLGTFPVLSLADARDRAKEALASVAAGRDPATEKTANRQATTIAQLAEEYIERHAKPNKKTWKEDKRVIDKDVLARWRYSKPADITRSDVRALVESVADRGAPIHANRVLALVRKMFNFGIERDWLEHNPCHLVKGPGKEQSRDRVLTDDEIRKVWAALDDEPPPIGAIFRLRLLTAQRGGEVMHMRWSDIDLESGWWTIPAEHSKNGLSHRVPLSPHAVGVLKDFRAWQHQRLTEINEGRRKKRLDPKEPSEYVFPAGRGEQGAMTWLHKAAERIRNTTAISFRPHDLRRTAASLMTGGGTQRLVVSKILNHRESGVTAVYDRHSYDQEKRIALDSWAKRLEAILSGASTPTNIIQFNRG